MSFTASNKVFGIVDCNNFYVSCERVFNPRLESKPIIVLSNNDGCVISRSNEAKRLGIPMAIPLFKINALVKQHKIQVFSSNYTLYGDLSARVMTSLTSLWPDIEIYSIDEAFLDLSAAPPESLEIFGENMVGLVKMWTGIPITLGVGPTKTLAKVANYFAKKNGRKTFNICNPVTRDFVLKGIDVTEIWGVGQRWGKTLKSLGLLTAADLMHQDPFWVRKKFNKCLASTVLELQGVVCTDLETEVAAKKSLVVSRSYSQPMSKLAQIEAVSAHYASRGAEKLRRKAQVAQGMTVFLQTNRFDTSEPRYHWSQTFTLPGPTSNSATLVKYTRAAIKKMYQPGKQYHKSGIMLFDLSPEATKQSMFWGEESPSGEVLMNTLDKINGAFGPGMLRLAVTAPPRLRSLHRTPCYTTQWQQLAIVQSGQTRAS